jgi:hypothetical protein
MVLVTPAKLVHSYPGANTWRIDDAQFVSQWAFNFTLNSGNYAIQSVTVIRGGK